MRMTVLQMVQDILSDMNSFEVNDINDTKESRQVAQIIESVYYTLHTYRYWPVDQRAVALEAGTFNGVTMPSALAIPEDVIDIGNIYYNKKALKYCETEDFIDMVMKYNSDSDDVESYDVDGINLFCFNDQDPTYYTTMTLGQGTTKQTFMVTDAYDKSVGAALFPSKSLLVGHISPDFTQSNTFIPTMPTEAFSYFLAEAKARCFSVIKQMENPSAIADARRLRSFLAVEKGVVQSRDSYPNYGRK